MSRRQQLTAIAVGIVTVAGLLLWFRFVEPVRSHSIWSRRVRADIEMLAHKRPPKVTKGQWEFVLGWTMNLHGNCGSIWSAVEPEWQDGFAVEFERRLAGSLTLADIEWVWDQYARHTTYGQSYSDRWRPMRAEEFQNAQPGCFGMPVD